MSRIVLIFGIVGMFYADARIHWTVADKTTNKTCIIVDADSVAVDVNFMTKSGTVEAYNATVDSVVSVVGSCGDSQGNETFQTLTVSFLPGENSSSSNQPWDLQLSFGSVDKNAFKLIDYRLITAHTSQMNASYIYNFTKSDSKVEVEWYGSNAFKCSTTKLPLVNDSVVEMEDVRVIAFAALNSSEFSKDQTYEMCSFDSRTSDMVPVFVGACLVGLVVVVLVAYLIGRARAKRQGYASV